MWAFLVGILFVVVVVLLLLIFYVSPELAPVSIGPTGATGPLDYEEFETTAQFFDDETSVVSDIAVSFVRVGSEVTVTIPGFSFDDGASSKTGQILASEVVPENMRPVDDVYEMASTVSSSRKVGIMAIGANGDIAFYVDAAVANLITGATWATSNNSTGRSSASYTLL